MGPLAPMEPDGRRIYVGTSPVGSILAPCSIMQLRKYFQDCSDGKLEAVHIGSEEFPAGAGAWCHDSNWIVVAGWQRGASLWDASKGDLKQIIGENITGRNPLDGLFSDIAATADGKRVAFGRLLARFTFSTSVPWGKTDLASNWKKAWSQ